MLRQILFLLNARRIRSCTRPLVALIVYLQSAYIWLGHKEFASFKDCLFFSRKQAKHPPIGERSVEYPWVYERVRDLEDCLVLDVGAKQGLPITDLLLQRNVVVTIDPNIEAPIQKGSLSVMKGDVRATAFEDSHFDAVVAVSTLEHIGVSGRYRITEQDAGGDMRAVQEIFRILKPGGKLLVTLPYGVGDSLPLNRLYDDGRIQQLFRCFRLIEAKYYRYFDNYGLWLNVPEETAALTNWDQEPWYALACFHLVK